MTQRFSDLSGIPHGGLAARYRQRDRIIRPIHRPARLAGVGEVVPYELALFRRQLAGAAGAAQHDLEPESD